MLSCLVPSSTSRFGQEDNIINQSMPSSPAFTMQFPSLASTLHHHHQSKSSSAASTTVDDENSSGVPANSVGATSPAPQQTDFMVTCPQCHVRLAGFESLRDHIASEHPHDKLNIEPSFPSPPAEHLHHRANADADGGDAARGALAHDSDDNESNHSSSEAKVFSNNNNNSQEKNNNSINANTTTPTHNNTSAPNTPPPAVNGPLGTTAVGDLPTSPFGGHLPHNLHPAAAAQFMAALAMQQQQQQQNGGPISPTSQLMGFNGHHPAHQHLHHHQQHPHHMSPHVLSSAHPTHVSAYDMDTMRSTSSPGSCGGSDNNSAASSISPPYQCLHCPVLFQTRHELEKHELMHSPNAQSPQSLNGVSQSCKICNKAFANVYRLQRHMISHDESALLRKFKCNQCDKAFKFKHHLKEHVRIHSGEKPFGCDNCGKRFSHSGSFSSHMTSKKCISMGLKLNTSRSLLKALDKATGTSTSPNSLKGSSPNLSVKSDSGSGGPLVNPMNYFAGDGSNVSANPFYSNLLPKYTDYDNVMKAALLAPFTSPFYSMALDPRMHPYSIQRLLELTAAGQQQQHSSLTPPPPSNEEEDEDLSKDSRMAADLEEHDDEEGEEEEEDTSMLELSEEHPEEDNHDEPKLIMDLDDAELKKSDHTKSADDVAEPINDKENEMPELPKENKVKQEEHMPPPIIMEKPQTEAEICQTISQIKQEKPEEDTTTEQEESHQHSERHMEEQSSEDHLDAIASELKCSRCAKKFNHPTELVQHEKVLCGYIKQELEQQFQQQQQQFLGQSNNSGSVMASSDNEEEPEDRESLSRNDCSSGGESNAERKVRVRTAITEEQQQQLKQHYAINARPSREEFRMIAARLQLDARVVQVWFQNNRSRERKLQYNNANNTNSNKITFPMNMPAASENIGTPEAEGVQKPSSSTDEMPLDLSVKPLKANGSSQQQHSPLYGIAPLQTTNGSGAGDLQEAINLSRKMSPPSLSPSSAAAVPAAFKQQAHAAAAAAALYFSAPSPANGAPNLPHNMRQTPSPIEAPLMGGPQQSSMPRGAAAFPSFSQLPPYMMPAAISAAQRSLMPMEALFQMTPGSAEYAARQHSIMNSIKLGVPSLDFRGTSLSPGSEKRSWRDDDSRISHEDEYAHAQAQAAAALLPPKPKRAKAETHGHAGDPDLPFICDQCDKAFAKQSSLARHKYEHSGQRPYQCMDCPKAFKHKHHLTEHKRLHSGEKPFQCTKCLKRFSHSGSYSQHMNHRYSYCKPYRE